MALQKLYFFIGYGSDMTKSVTWTNNTLAQVSIGFYHTSVGKTAVDILSIDFTRDASKNKIVSFNNISWNKEQFSHASVNVAIEPQIGGYYFSITCPAEFMVTNALYQATFLMMCDMDCGGGGGDCDLSEVLAQLDGLMQMVGNVQGTLGGVSGNVSATKSMVESSLNMLAPMSEDITYIKEHCGGGGGGGGDCGYDKSKVTHIDDLVTKIYSERVTIADINIKVNERLTKTETLITSSKNELEKYIDIHCQGGGGDMPRDVSSLTIYDIKTSTRLPAGTVVIVDGYIGDYTVIGSAPLCLGGDVTEHIYMLERDGSRGLFLSTAIAKKP